MVGTLAAVLLGVLALLQIARDPNRVAGRGYAIAGIAIGLPMTAATILAVIFAGSSLELFGLTGMVGAAHWAGKLDFDGPMDAERPNEGFAIRRPSTKWGVYKSPSLPHVWQDLLLVVPEEDMVVLGYADSLFDRNTGIEACRDKAVRDFKNNTRVGLFNNSGSADLRAPQTTEKETTRPPAKDKVAMIEVLLDKRLAGEDKSFLLRVYKREGDDRMFVVIGGVRRSQFVRLEPQIREAMDGFRLLPPTGQRLRFSVYEAMLLPFR